MGQCSAGTSEAAPPRRSGRLSLRNLPDPELMTDADRGREVVSLVAKGFLRHGLCLMNGTNAALASLCWPQTHPRFLFSFSARKRCCRPEPASSNRDYRTWMRAAHSRTRGRVSYPARGQ